MKVIAVDYDGTLCLPGDMCNIPLKDTMAKWWDTPGVMIIIYTARPSHHRVMVEAWLRRHGVKYHSIVLDKMPADIYVDNDSITALDLEKI